MWFIWFPALNFGPPPGTASSFFCLVAGGRQHPNYLLTAIAAAADDCQVLSVITESSQGMPSHGFLDMLGFLLPYQGKLPCGPDV